MRARNVIVGLEPERQHLFTGSFVLIAGSNDGRTKVLVRSVVFKCTICIIRGGCGGMSDLERWELSYSCWIRQS